ncbi:hypothetical protein [Candidatus Methanoperedens nitratireducens]|uniref:hypothetical protein n=1 Tax=Candidatus Methanoperedens nitratireducens TaxID=1392998 RepID=UPI0015C9B6E4|nr:hypothetical protein [Candidatus Methanoperedens nitroreducens]
MHTKVVVTASHAFLDLGMPSLRFNFRGVGRSSGKYDEGRRAGRCQGGYKLHGREVQEA